MPSPDVGDVHVDRLLTNVSIGWDPSGGFIADQVFPIVRVDHQSGLYQKYNKSAFARDESQPAAASGANNIIRAPGTQAATTGFGLTTGTYRAINYALGVELPDEVLFNADNPLQLERAATVLVTSVVRLARERAFVRDFMKTGVWGTDATIAAKWSDYGASSPIEDLRTQLRVLRRAALNTPGGKIHLTMGALVWDRIADHPDFLDRIKYTERGIVGPDLLGALLSTSLRAPVQVNVGTAVFTADEEGTAESSVTYTDVFDDDVLITYAPGGDNPSVLFPSSGYTFGWPAGAAGGNGLEWIRRVREERERVTVIENHSYWDQVATDTATGIFISDAVD